MPRLSRITVFPIKSLDGQNVAESIVLPSGSLRHDRRWAIVDLQGGLLNGRRSAGVHAVRARFEDNSIAVELRHGDQRAQFSLETQADEAGHWLSTVLDRRCKLVEDARQGFPDDRDAVGPTLISEASLQTAAGWYDDISTADMRRRLRTNLEIADCDAFWEDCLAGEGIRFSIGDVVFSGQKICQRCIVPARDPASGRPTAAFARLFAQHRQQSLPTSSPRSRFDHFYRIAINTSVALAPNGSTIRVGDPVRLIH